MVPTLRWRQGCSSEGFRLSKHTTLTFTSPGAETHVVLVTSPVTAGPLRAPCSQLTLLTLFHPWLPAVLPVPYRWQLLGLDLTLAISTYFEIRVIFTPSPVHHPFFSLSSWAIFGSIILLGLLALPVALPHTYRKTPPNHRYPQMHANWPRSDTPPLQSQRGDSHTQQDVGHQPSAISIHPTVEWDLLHKRPSPPACSCLWGDISVAFPEMYERPSSCRAISWH